MLAEVAHRPDLTAVIGAVCGQQGGVVPHRREHDPERWVLGHRTARHRLHQVSEQPGSAETAPADDHSVAVGRPDHRERVGGLPDVTVAEHRDAVTRIADRLSERTDGLPPRLAGVVLLDGARVERHPGDPLLGADQTRAHIGAQRIGETHPELGGDRHPVRGRARHRGGDDRAKEGRAGRNGRSPTSTRDLGRRTAEVEVDVVDPPLGADPSDRLPHLDRIAPVELE